jgi:hypothetical protein
MGYFLNTTDNYHINDLNSLDWELTVGNALYPKTSPCRNALQIKSSLGIQLYRFLEGLIPLNKVHNILEIGGGLGYLMRDFISLNPQLKATMLDISPYLLKKQNDILQIEINAVAPFELVIMNENLGDLPTLVAHTEENIGQAEELACYPEKATYFSKRYNLPFRKEENINIGAMEALEKLCHAGIKYIYLSEHSCEAFLPMHLKPYINFESAGIPEKITLKGHNEYTIKFSYLQKIAEIYDYKVTCGPIADFLPLEFNGKVMTALRLSTPFTAQQEIIRQFVYDLYKYEYMLMIKNTK